MTNSSKDNWLDLLKSSVVSICYRVCSDGGHFINYIYRAQTGSARRLLKFSVKSGPCEISRSPVDSSTLQKSSDGLCCILCPVTSGTISVAGSVDSPHVRTQELTNDLSISRQSPHYMEIYRLLGSAA